MNKSNNMFIDKNIRMKTKLKINYKNLNFKY